MNIHPRQTETLLDHRHRHLFFLRRSNFPIHPLFLTPFHGHRVRHTFQFTQLCRTATRAQQQQQQHHYTRCIYLSFSRNGPPTGFGVGLKIQQARSIRLKTLARLTRRGYKNGENCEITEKGGFSLATAHTTLHTHT